MIKFIDVHGYPIIINWTNVTHIVEHTDYSMIHLISNNYVKVNLTLQGIQEKLQDARRRE